MSQLTIRHSPELQKHLESFVVDGSTVRESLFADGRLTYPRRAEVEQELMGRDPYEIWHEARVIEGFPAVIRASIRLLSAEATERFSSSDPTLDLLWQSHAAYALSSQEGPSLDRIVSALVMIQQMVDGMSISRDLDDASYLLVRELVSAGFPSSARALEELWDGAAPACVGLGLVEVG